MPFCIKYKVVKEFKQSEDNSTRAIAEKLGYTYSQVDASINFYLNLKKERLQKRIAAH